MIKLDKTICLVIVDTREHDQALKTIRHNMSLMHFDQVLWFTDIECDLPEITTIPTQTIRSADQYSRFLLTGLTDHVKTELVLITQCDGFIYNPGGWKEEFSAYDYIGAPWWYYPYNHVPPHPPSGPRTCVGNGGFSIRSTRLCNEVANLINENRWDSTVPEDLFICRTLRPYLEDMGLRFAPEHLAHQFCCEDRPYNGQFGVHGHETFKLNTELKKP